MSDRLLGSSRTGDLLRALWTIERSGGQGAELGVALLRHPDDEVRARAVAVLGQSPRSLHSLAECAKDPSPRVRLAALHVYGPGSHAPYALELTGDPDWSVAMIAYEQIARSKNSGIEREAFWALLKARNFRAINLHYSNRDFASEGYASLSSRRTAAEIVSWLEAEVAKTGGEGGESDVLDALVTLLGPFRADHLAPLVARLVALFEATRSAAPYENGVAAALTKLESAEADRAINVALADTEGTEAFESLWSSIFGSSSGPAGFPLQSRTTPLANAVSILWRLAKSSPDVWKEDQRVAALVLLAKWKIEGAGAALVTALKKDEFAGPHLEDLAERGTRSGGAPAALRSAGEPNCSRDRRRRGGVLTWSH